MKKIFLLVILFIIGCEENATEPADCIPLVTVLISDLSENADDTFTATINMENTVPVAGWQFDLTSIPAGVTLLAVYGGSSEDAEHMVSFSFKRTLMYFSFFVFLYFKTQIDANRI